MPRSSPQWLSVRRAMLTNAGHVSVLMVRPVGVRVGETTPMAKLEPSTIIERAEIVLGAITDDWQTRAEIASKLEAGPLGKAATHMALQRSLAFLLRRRFIDISLVPLKYGPGGNMTDYGLSLGRRAYRYRLKLVRD